MRIRTAALTLLLPGCVALRAPRAPGALFSAPSPACSALERKVVGFNLAAIVLGGLAAAAGAATSISDVPAARYSLAGGAAGLTIAGAVTGYLATYEAASYAKECPQ